MERPTRFGWFWLLGMGIACLSCQQADRRAGGETRDGSVPADGEVGEVEHVDTNGADGGGADVGPEKPDGSPGDGSSRSKDTVEAGTDDTRTSCGRDSVDSDADGLSDCRERRTCTDPEDGDTDGDGVGDAEELDGDSDPCDPDTDDDGVDDGEEIEHGLDPTRRSTYRDGIVDGERWRLTACETTRHEPLVYHENTVADWVVALPPAVDGYTELAIDGASAPVAAAMYGDPLTEVAGGLVSKQVSHPMADPTTALASAVPAALEAAGSVVERETGGAFETHDGHTAAVGRYVLETSEATGIVSVRNQIIAASAPFSRGDATGWPTSSATSYEAFRVRVAVIHRDRPTAPDQSLVAIAVSPKTKHAAFDRVRIRMRDTTSTTAIASPSSRRLDRCRTYRPAERSVRAEFYWVIDQSGSMIDDERAVKKFTRTFERRVRRSSLDYRLGVTNMDKRNNGHLRVGPGWHTATRTFMREVKEATINCRWGAPWHCGSEAEYGLESAKRGIRYMTGHARQAPAPAERVREQAAIITIFLSDDDDRSLPWGDEAFNRAMAPYERFFTDRTTAFAIVSEQHDCGGEGRGYKAIAQATGGAVASVCNDDGSAISEKIIAAADRVASRYVLGHTPIASSLRVLVDGSWVPRSRENGYVYLPRTNAIKFFGEARPTAHADSSTRAEEVVAVAYETYVRRCKGAGSTSCRR